MSYGWIKVILSFCAIYAVTWRWSQTSIVLPESVKSLLSSPPRPNPPPTLKHTLSLFLFLSLDHSLHVSAIAIYHNDILSKENDIGLI